VPSYATPASPPPPSPPELLLGPASLWTMTVPESPASDPPAALLLLLEHPLDTATTPTRAADIASPKHFFHMTASQMKKKKTTDP
jgi:hypothetical protein